MLDWLYQFGLFLAEAIVIVVAVIIVISLIARQKMQAKSPQAKLVVHDRGKHFKERREELELNRVGADKADKLRKEWAKDEKKQAKKDKKSKKGAKDNSDNVVWVLNFNGDMSASATPSLTEEISSLLLTAKEGDEVVIRLESGGGMVHAYGLASAQLDRLREANLKLTICVDKVAASGGYMMACCADYLIAAPFAVVGSIGVVAQVPNIHRLLKKNDVDVEILTAGKYKRTLTMLGENTDEGRAKFLEDLADTHDLFKNFVVKRRPQLTIEDIATGEIWYGSEAVSNGLVDAVSTSEAYLQDRAKEAKVLEISLKPHRTLSQRLGKQTAVAIEKGVDRAIERVTRMKWEKQ